jgi:glycosyltransferase involved in cell wall biosynthesis
MIDNKKNYKYSLISFVIPVRRDYRVVKCVSELLSYASVESLHTEIIVCGELDSGKLNKNTRFMKVVPADKGRCVKQGVLASNGEFIIVCDADFPVLPGDITNLLENLTNADVSLGNRYLPESHFIIIPPLHRRIISTVFRFLVSLLFGMKNFDTQCGIKAFKRSAALTLFTNQIFTSLVYDVQIILFALQQKMQITQVPVHWKSSASTTINLWTGMPLALIDLFRLWKGLKIDGTST